MGNRNEGKMATRTLISLLVGLTLLCGCATIDTRCNKKLNKLENLYPATRTDLFLECYMFQEFDGLGCFGLCLIVIPDFIPSIITDTILLPYDITLVCLSKKK